jgi:general stress protein 26
MSYDILTALPTAPHIPQPQRPLPREGYGIPEDEVGLLDWQFVTERVAVARNYWVSTVQPDGRPHVAPTWGIWHDNTLYFGGGADTRWSRNLAAYPEVVVHLESGDEVVILYGKVGRIMDTAVMEPIDHLYEQKYNMRHGPPVWVLTLRKVLAWAEFPTTTTRWLFGDR